MKKLLTMTLASLAVVTSTVQAEDLRLGYVNFKMCLEVSKQGKHEKQAFEALKGQMQQTLESTDRELEGLAKQLEDQDYLDTLSPIAEEELKQKFNHLSQEFSRYQAQYYQLLNQANYKMFQSLHEKVSVAAGHVREKENLSLILNEESAFAISPGLDMTSKVVVEMDRLYDLENEEIAQIGRKGNFSHG